VRAEAVRAFAPGRANLIGEHTDYNGGLALPFAIEQGVTVDALATATGTVAVHAAELGERDEFSAREPQRAAGWRAYVRGVVAELAATGAVTAGAAIEITGDVPRGAGLSSSAALEVAVALALLELARALGSAAAPLDRIELARLCSRAESEWAGAMTGLLDQLASLCGESDRAVLIDFATLDVAEIPLELGGWRLVVVDTGERHAHGTSGYNARREECMRAAALLCVGYLSEAAPEQAEQLPAPLGSRALHVLGENDRVRAAARALRAGDVAALGPLLDASHASLRDLYDVSTHAVERTVERVRSQGAAGARLMGGGFGGSVLALFAPGHALPGDAREVRPGGGARVLAS
jgi:galactokinase